MRGLGRPTWQFYGIVLAVITVSVAAMMLYRPALPVPPDGERNYCTEEQRQADSCIQVYEPVCGWFGQDVQCFRYPCAATYSNACFACLGENVEYWTEGECPEA